MASIKTILKTIKTFILFPYTLCLKLYMAIGYLQFKKQYKKKIESLRKQYGKEPIKVGFIGYLDGVACDVFSDLYRIFDKDPNFTCEVVVVPYTHDAKDKMISKHRKAMSYVESLGFRALPGYNEQKDTYNDYHNRYDITFYEIEYNWVDPLFKIDNFRNSISFIIPYGQYLADNINAHMHFQMMSEIYCIFPTSVAVCHMMKKYSMVFGINVCNKYLGNPKIDRFFKSKEIVDVWSKAKSSQKRIIWAPHHTWANYANFLRYSNYMLELASRYKDSLFISIKPHPALKDSLKAIDGWTDNQIEEYFDKWKNGENTALFEGEWFNLFQSSDAMIMDSLSFMIEYSLTGKPSCVLYKVNESGKRLMKFSECGETLYKHLYHAKTEEEIQAFVEMILRNEDSECNTRNEYVKENYLPPYNKTGSENIYDYVVKIIS